MPIPPDYMERIPQPKPPRDWPPMCVPYYWEWGGAWEQLKKIAPHFNSQPVVNDCFNADERRDALDVVEEYAQRCLMELD